MFFIIVVVVEKKGGLSLRASLFYFIIIYTISLPSSVSQTDQIHRTPLELKAVEYRDSFHALVQKYLKLSL